MGSWITATHLMADTDQYLSFLFLSSTPNHAFPTRPCTISLMTSRSNGFIRYALPPYRVGSSSTLSRRTQSLETMITGMLRVLASLASCSSNPHAALLMQTQMLAIHLRLLDRTDWLGHRPPRVLLLCFRSVSAPECQRGSLTLSVIMRVMFLQVGHDEIARMERFNVDEAVNEST